ncbi:MAG: capsule biosynthesis protein CapA [Pseudomonadota bacterium]
MLVASGADVRRIGFNRGDEFEWRGMAGYTAFTAPQEGWEAWITAYLSREDITDLVLYGDSRPIHRIATAAARTCGITVHCFEEGYLRPYWATYERAGANGNSRLMDMGVAEMRAALGPEEIDLPEAPASWGAMWHHTWLGFLYHANILLRNGAYPNHRPHRGVGVAREFYLHTVRMVGLPIAGLRRRVRERRLRRSAAPYHLVLLQLSHDSAMRDHSRFSSNAEFAEHCINAFAEGAPGHHRLVFKAHPLEDGREPIAGEIRRLAARLGVGERVDVIPGGKLGPLLDRARTVVTVNSTAGQQALWRGLPLRVHGRAVYAKPEFVAPQPLAAFFRGPMRPDARAYRDFRRYLLATSQIRGGFYARRDREALLRQVVDRMRDPADPYDALLRDRATLPEGAVAGQPLRVVS